MRGMIRVILPALLLLPVLPANGYAQELYWGGFVEALWGAGLVDENPTGRDYPVGETRFQLRLESFSDNAEVFARADFIQDGFDSVGYDWELREAYVKFRFPIGLDFKVGRQVVTWGTGDLVFINDVFAKDYQSFFVGRQDQYLKAPQTAARTEWYTRYGSISLVAIPDFEPNILPTGERLSFYNPMSGAIVGSAGYTTPVEPGNDFEGAEIALRYAKSIGGFKLAAYAYRGFFKEPKGARFTPDMELYYPRLNVYGASLRGQVYGGILWIEGGYYDSREDRCGGNFYIENSSTRVLIGFERQVAADFTGNLQFYTEIMNDYGKYEKSFEELVAAEMLPADYPEIDEVRTLFTSRWTRQLYSQTVTLSLFGFYSPTDEDGYIRFSGEYKYTDELSLMAGGNIFDGRRPSTMFGQFDLNDNLYVKINYGF